MIAVFNRGPFADGSVIEWQAFHWLQIHSRMMEWGIGGKLFAKKTDGQIQSAAVRRRDEIRRL